MSNLDATDRRLVVFLKQDSRASITQLAGELGLSRATVKVRLERLVRSGTIRRFTIEMTDPGADDLIHAVMLIELQGPLASRVISRLRKQPQITDLHTTNGSWDLVARIEAESLSEFDLVLRDVREIPGVSNSETCLLLDRAR